MARRKPPEFLPLPEPRTIRFRPAVADDIPAIEQIERASFARAAERFDRRQIRSLIANPRATVTVAAAGPRLLGWAAGLLRRYRHAHSGRIYAIAVDPDARGLRIGRGLMDRMIRALDRRGAERISLEVHVANQSVIRFYHNLGFTPARRLPNYYGRGHHAHRMVRIR